MSRVWWLGVVALGGCNAVFGVSDLSFEGGGGAVGTGGQGGVAPTCDDGIQNGDESGVDCGGACPLCEGTLGASCAADDDCDSGHCAADDGICCDSACDLLCEACAETKTGSPDGICDFVTEGTDPDEECPATEPTTCGAAGLGCSGNLTLCISHGEEVTCTPAACAAEGNVHLAASSCDALGRCPDPVATVCDPYECEDPGCLTACDGEEDCISSHWCQNSSQMCQPKRPSGANCTSNKQCQSGVCNTGVCL